MHARALVSNSSEVELDESEFGSEPDSGSSTIGVEEALREWLAGGERERLHSDLSEAVIAKGTEGIDPVGVGGSEELFEKLSDELSVSSFGSALALTGAAAIGAGLGCTALTLSLPERSLMRCEAICFFCVESWSALLGMLDILLPYTVMMF